jgi:ketosteroid isomerase-like protein
MSQENVDLHYRVFDAFNRRDLDALLELMDDDVESVPRAVAMEGGSYHGHDGIRRWGENLFDVFPDFTAQAVEVRDPGDLTIAAIRLRGRGTGSDAPSDQTIWQVVRWRRGKCVWWATFDTRAEALEAVGLSESEPVTEKHTDALDE